MPLKGTNQELGRPHNRRIVLESIRRNGAITRAEIARRVGLTVQTISTIAAELEALGYVSWSPGVAKGRGFPAPVLALNPKGAFACGVYVTPRGIEAGLIDLSGEVLTHRPAVGVPPTADSAFDRIAEIVADLVADVPRERVIGVGMAMPGPFDIESMSCVGPTTMEQWRGIDVYARLKDAVPFPVFVEVDSAAAAHGERLYGIGDRLKSFYYLYLGVGLGGSFINDDRVLRGAWGNAGEIGHIPLIPDGDLCPCGNRGCLERYLSLEAYERRCSDIGEAAWLDEVAPIFRAAIVTIENLFDPEAVVLGGLAPEGLRHRLLDLAAELPNSLAARRDRASPRVVLSDCGTDVVIRGAAALAVSRVFSPQPSADKPDDPFARTAAKETTA